MPRVKLFNEEKALDNAMKLFWQKGFEATSLNDLTEHLGIGKGSFYATFKSKENLFNRCIERYTDANLPLLNQALETQADYKNALKILLQDYVEGLMQDTKRKGCFMANSCSLVQNEAMNVVPKIAEHYARIENYFVSFLQRKGVSHVKAKSVSATIITFLIGASQQSKINQNETGYLSTVENIVGLLD